MKFENSGDVYSCWLNFKCLFEISSKGILIKEGTSSGSCFFINPEVVIGLFLLKKGENVKLFVNFSNEKMEESTIELTVFSKKYLPAATKWLKKINKLSFLHNKITYTRMITDL